jgi:hypothetical protein
MHVIVGLFEVNETIDLCMAWYFHYLEIYLTLYQVITKDEGNNLTSMVPTCTPLFVVSFWTFHKFMKVFVWVVCCLKHVRIHATNDEKVSIRPRQINVKDV